MRIASAFSEESLQCQGSTNKIPIKKRVLSSIFNSTGLCFSNLKDICIHTTPNTPLCNAKPSLSHKTILLPSCLSPPPTNDPLNPPPPSWHASINTPPKKIRTPKHNNPINNRTTQQTLPPLSCLTLLRNDLLD
jgi:hypothetical protein